MKMKNIFNPHNRFTIGHRGLALLMCVVLGLSMVNMAFSTMMASSDDETPVYGVDPLFNGTLNLDRVVSKDKLDKSMHLIIRHWHTEQNPDPRVTEKTDKDKTVIVGIYIVPQDEDYTEFKYYARAYTGSQESEIKKNKGHYLEIRREDQTGDPNNRFSRYIRLENDGTVSIFAWPFVDNNGVYYEHFAGFSVSAGQSAVTVEDGTPEKYYADARLIIDPSKVSTVALVKSHLFYVSELESVDGEIQQGDRGDFEDYIDTSTSATKKYYNASAGLHTDKTAGMTTNTKYNDNRTFDLDLESWYNNGDPVDVGMILDASGSMGFTSNTPNPINVLYDSEGNYNPFGLSEETLAKCDSSVALKDAFLTDEELAKIVNPRKTDNSKIRSSGYSYFIYDPRSTTAEFVPLGYWDGGLPKAESLIGYYNFDGDALTNSVTGKSATTIKQLTSDSNISFGETTTTKPTVTNGKLIIGSSSPTVGLQLDAKPTDGTFTISFSINKSGSDAGSTVNQNPADVLYVGALAPDNNHYFRAIREGRPANNANSGPFGSVRRAWFTGYQGNPNSNASLPNDTVSATSVFHNADIHVVTYVFKNGKLTSYFDGTEKLNITNNTGDIAQTKDLTVDDYNIILNGFNNKYNGADIQIDDIYVFDDALTDTQIRNFADIKNYANSSGSPNYPVGTKTGAKNPADIIPALDTDGNILGTVVPDFVAKTPYERAGWYYINPSGNWDTNYYAEKIQSGKTLNGILPNYSFNDKLPESRPRAGVTAKNTDRTFTSSENTPVKFYIGANGYLRCLYYIRSDGIDNGRGASFVYQNNDQDYIKVEALQRALGSFITGLESRSPESMVSAVRFSTDKIPDSDLDKLVVLDWTADIKSAQLVLSGQRGDGGTRKGTNSYPSDFTELTGLDGIEQYNYGLTGSTSTQRGLKSFWQNLAKRLDPDVEKIDKSQDYDPSQADVTGKNGKKYVIIFTDGKDTDLNDNAVENTEAFKVAEKLKKAGYTIFCILLAGGPVKFGADDYNKAYNFLDALSGPGAGSKELERYVYSTEDLDIRFPNGVPDDYNPDAPDYSTGMSNVDALVNCFTGANGILDEISEDLTDYNVQDYIDPRFDLVDMDGNIWHLNAGGEVVLKDQNGNAVKDENAKAITYKLSDSQNKKQTIILFDKEDLLDSNLKNKLTEEASEAELHYDDSKNMYYLVWTEQTIPGSNIGSSKIRTWHGKVTVRAKDDFLGGNAILTNGNQASENYVYYPGDANASSGIDRDKLAKIEHPSKGFPRTTVNVAPSEAKATDTLAIYMGENLAKSVVKSLIDEALGNGDFTTAYFWQYLERYVNYYNAHREYYDTEYANHSDLFNPKFFDKDGKEIKEFFDEKGNKLSAPAGLYDKDGKMSYEKLSEIIFGTSYNVLVPYGYLPDFDDNNQKINQTGQKAHETDIVGHITYSANMTMDGVDSSVTDPGYKEGDEAKDTVGREVNATIFYDPFDSCQCGDDCADCADCAINGHCDNCAYTKLTERKKANDTLVTDNDYAWNRGYKDIVGNSVDSETIEGDHKTEIVSGEIALQLEVPNDVVPKLQKLGINQLTYTADLIRNFEGSTTRVCTFKATIEIPQAARTAAFSTRAAEESIKSTAEVISIAEEYEYVWDNMYGQGKPAGYMGGLPIGTYSLSMLESTPNSVKFYAPYIVSDPGEYEKGGIFGLDIAGKDHPEDYIASLGEENISLGVAHGDSDYTQSRYGIFRVPIDILPGDLRISKTVEGGEPEKAPPFVFDVELTILEDFEVSTLPEEAGTLAGQIGYAYKGSGGADDGWLVLTKKAGTDNTYTGQVTLKHGQSIQIKDLPVLTDYKVTEHSADGYNLKSAVGNIGKIPADDEATASFTNVPNESELLVTKRVLCDPLKMPANPSELGNAEFNFKLTVKDQTDPVSAYICTYNSTTGAWDKGDEEEITFDANNSYAFTLKDRQGLWLTGLSDGAEYTVTETLDAGSKFTFGRVSDSNGYKMTVREKDRSYSVTGETSIDELAQAHYFNIALNFEIPLSGGNNRGILYIISFVGMFLLLSGIVFILLTFKKKRSTK
ncbi:MAG: hypothetical protein J1E85_01640 [Ruminococcus sp.]|nr:hypothetical protein [Ruminococcus sp.]